MRAKSVRFPASQVMLAPRSSITDSPFMVGKKEAMAGRSMPGRVLRTNFAMAMSAPVLPADTTPRALPSCTALIARRMDEPRPDLSAIDGFSSLRTTSSQWVSRATSLRRFMPARSGATSDSRPKNRKSTSGCRWRAILAPRTTTWGALSPPMASRAMVSRPVKPLRSRSDAGPSPGGPPARRDSGYILLNDLAVVVVAAGAADVMRTLELAAIPALGIAAGLEGIMGPALVTPGFGDFLLRNRHFSSSFVSGPAGRCPAGQYRGRFLANLTRPGKPDDAPPATRDYHPYW